MSTRLLLVERRRSISGWAASKSAQARQQPFEREAADRAERHHLAPAVRLEAIEQQRDPVERAAQFRQQRLALVGQRQPARQAVEERGAEPLLQPLHLMAERRRRHVELDRRLLEARMARRRLEGAQGVERKIGPDQSAAPSARQRRSGRSQPWRPQCARAAPAARHASCSAPRSRRRHNRRRRGCGAPCRRRGRRSPARRGRSSRRSKTGRARDDRRSPRCRPSVIASRWPSS